MSTPTDSPRLTVRSFFRADGFVVRYGIAVVSVLAAAFFYSSIDQYLEKQATPFAVFTVPVMIAASYGGMGPGLLATALAWLIGDYYWVEPLYSLSIKHVHEALHTSVFLGVGIAISGMSRALRVARARAEAANRAKDEFLAVLSHELRNPLAPVVAAVSSIADTPGLPADVYGDLAVIRRNVGVQTRLIDDLLDTNRVAHGKLHLQWEPACDAHAVIAHALEVCAPEAAAQVVDLAYSAEAARHHVRGDPARLQQVFWNLLRNAIKFTPQGGQVTVRTDNVDGVPAKRADGATNTGAAGDPVLRVRVIDSGAGIGPDDLTRIFKPFEQGSGHTSRTGGGLGIGLALSKGLVELHGGRIEAVSAGPGRGAVFTVELPTVATPAAITPPAAAPAARTDRASAAAAARRDDSPEILFVEDDPDAGPLLLRLLRRAGYHVTLASGVGAALREAEARHFDLLISDLQLADGSGIDLMRTMRQRQGVRGICVSGFGSDADRQQSKNAGFELHLVKPFDVETLKGAIERTTAHNGAPTMPAVTP